jgi:phage/plasmid primase, P4 family, C-terminal domain
MGNNDKDELDAICTRIRERYGVPLKNGRKYPVARNWQGRVWSEFTDEEKQGWTGYGVNCGRAGLVVIDCDKHDESADGVRNFHDLCDEHGFDPESTFTVSTPSGGRHYYFSRKGVDEDVKIGNSSGGLPDGVDVRGSGGQVVGPGSRTSDGEYRIVSEATQAIRIPDWLLDVLLDKDADRDHSMTTSLLDEHVSAVPYNENEDEEEIGQSALEKTSADRIENTKGQTSDVSVIDWYNDPYVLKVLDNAVNAVSKAPKGRRNEELNAKSYSCGKAGVPEDLVLSDLADAAVGAGLSMREVVKTIRSGWSSGRKEFDPYRITQARQDWKEEQKAFKEEDVKDPDSDKAFRERMSRTTDVSLADELLKHTDLSGRHYYDPVSDRWMIRSSKGYIAPTSVKMFCASVSGYLSKLSSRMRSLDMDSKKADSLESYRRAQAVAGVLANQIDIDHDVLDSSPHEILADGRIVSLVDGSVREVDPSKDMFTRYTEVPYTNSPSETGMDKLNKVLSCIPKESREYVLDWFGVCLLGRMTQPAGVLFLVGNGSNGKSSLFSLMRRVIGTYLTNPKREVLTESSKSSRFSTHTLKGARAALFEELPKGRHLNANVFKELSGTQRIRGERKGVDEEEFEMRATVVIATNHLPQVTDTDNAIWRRLNMVEMPYRFTSNPENDNDILADPSWSPESIACLSHEDEMLQAALHVLVEHAKRYIERGWQLPPLPERVEQANKRWREESDRIMMWAEECLEKCESNKFTLRDDLYDSYCAYVTSMGWRPLARNAWKQDIEAHPWFKESGLVVKQVRYSSRMEHMSFRLPDRMYSREAPSGSRFRAMTGVRIVQ